MSHSTPRVGIIQPRLDGQGGVEKYGTYIIHALSQRVPVEVVSEHVVDPKAVERAFNVSLDGPQFRCDARCNPPARPSQGRLRDLQYRREMRAGYESVTRPYDLLIAHTGSLPWRSGARRSVLICHFPVVRGQRVDPSVSHSGLKALLSSSAREQRDIRARLDSWDRIIVNSEFTRYWVREYWHREAEIINPPIELPAAPDLSVKRPWIIAAGAFSRPSGEPGDAWSYKRQELMIDVFKQLCDRGLSGWELHMAGHVLPPTPHMFAWVDELRKRAEGYPVFLHPACPHSELLELYRHGSLFWHATGYGIDPQVYPEKTEHFGMVTVEAMGWGCVPVAIDMGGQPEIVEPGMSGHLWSTLEQLQEQTLALAADPAGRRRLAEGAVRRSAHFGLERFNRQLDALIDEELARLPNARVA